MKPIAVALFILTAAAVANVPLHGQNQTAAPLNGHEDRVAAAFKRLVEAEKDWRAAVAARDELGALGEHALSTVQRAARDHENVRVREACYQLLTTTFANDESALQTVANDGLSDSSSRIRYMCAFQLGEHRFYPAHRRLRIVLESPEAEELEKFAAAKSLAELGEADVLRVLLKAIESDWYMHRYLGNIGLKALSGKMLDDFEQYQYHEGAFVSGGREAVPMFDAIEHSERHAKRYAAMTAYFKWLKQERPDLYKHVTAAP